MRRHLLVGAIGRFVTQSRLEPFALLLHFRAPHLPYGPVPDADAAAVRDLDPTIPDVRGLDPGQVKKWTRDYLASVHSVDSGETRNLYRNDAARTVRAELEARLVEWRRGLESLE